VRKNLLLFLFALACSNYSLVRADVAKPVAADPALEQRVTNLTQELRCLVCQNQTIADSHAELAIDLKNQVREKLAQGQSDQDIIDYMVQRYGDFVVYRPPLKGTTLLLWFGPILLIVCGMGVLAWRLRRRNESPEALPAADLQRAAEMLGSDSDTKEST